jgi:hypothetical protein
MHTDCRWPESAIGAIGRRGLWAEGADQAVVGNAFAGEIPLCGLSRGLISSDG